MKRRSRKRLRNKKLGIEFNKLNCLGVNYLALVVKEVKSFARSVIILSLLWFHMVRNQRTNGSAKLE